MADSLKTRASWHSRGYIPHFEGGEIPQAVTFRLADALPQSVLATWRAEVAKGEDKVVRRRVEAYLDQGYGRALLKEPRLASLIQDALLHFDEERYRLSAWVVMPNHVHLLATPCSGYRLSQILHSLKSYTSHEINKLLQRTGKLWQNEYHDRYIRDAKHFAAAVHYIENNPVKARLCKHKTDWPYSSARHRHSGSAGVPPA